MNQDTQQEGNHLEEDTLEEGNHAAEVDTLEEGMPQAVEDKHQEGKHLEVDTLEEGNHDVLPALSHELGLKIILCQIHHACPFHLPSFEQRDDDSWLKKLTTK